ncbi:MAG TPA: DUF4233 domain-containing protein [Actinopolymorphaceae bacterium]
MKGVLAAILAFEAIIVALAIPGILALDAAPGVPTGVVVGVGLGLAAVCVVTAGLVRRTVGLVIGSVLQVAIILLGFAVAVMFVLGAVFAGLWVWCLVQDRKLASVRRETA